MPLEEKIFEKYFALFTDFEAWGRVCSIEGFQSPLAMFGNDIPRGSADQWLLVGSC